MGPALEIPPIDGAVVLAFSDEGMIKFDANALAGVALLIFAYARAGRGEDAVTLARDAHRVVGAEGFLALQLLLLRDNERWHDLLAAAEAADPHDHGRFEIMLQKARALEKTGRSTEALRAYNDLAIIDFDLPWLVAARQRLATQTKADMTEAIQPPPGLDSAGDGPTFASRGAFVYDPLRPLVGAPTREGPTPGVPPAADRSSSALRSKLLPEE